MENNFLKFLNIKKNNFVIFLFHGVIKKDLFRIRNYNNKHLLQKDFFKIVKILKKNGNVLSLDEIYNCIKYKISLPKNTYALTFDDGFENNYSIAAPILNDLNLPTTFYFSTDFVDNNTMSWIDKLEYCLEAKKRGTVYIPWLKKKVMFATVSSKINLLKQIRFFVKNNLKFNIDNFVESFFDDCKMKKVSKLDTCIDKKINWKQVKSLHESSLFTIGGHSHNHLSLGSLDNVKLDFQLNQSFRLFKEKLNFNIQHYSYPEGQKKDYNQILISKLKSKGIKLSASAIPGINHYKSDLFNLKRVQI
jgi:peptidoglycan/xylan/chitin deacetylase (PgdA/CDA1 family)